MGRKEIAKARIYAQILDACDNYNTYEELYINGMLAGLIFSYNTFVADDEQLHIFRTIYEHKPILRKEAVL